MDARAAADTVGAQVRAARGERDLERARATHWEAKANEAIRALATYESQVQTVAEDRDDDLRALRRAHQELAMTRAGLAGAEAERDQARSALAAAEAGLSVARAAQATARAEAEAAEAKRLAAQKAQRMAESERDAAVGVLERRPMVAGMEIDIRTAPEIKASDAADASEDAEDTRCAPAEPASPITSRPRSLGRGRHPGPPPARQHGRAPRARRPGRPAEGRLAAVVAITGSTSG